MTYKATILRAQTVKMHEKLEKKSINWIDTVKRNLKRPSICMQTFSFVDFTHQFSYIFKRMITSHMLNCKENTTPIFVIEMLSFFYRDVYKY